MTDAGASPAESIRLTRPQVEFLGDHLGQWARTFARDLTAASSLAYYARAAARLDAWVARELEALGATPAPARARVAAQPGDEDAFTCPMAPSE